VRNSSTARQDPNVLPAGDRAHVPSLRQQLDCALLQCTCGNRLSSDLTEPPWAITRDRPAWVMPFPPRPFGPSSRRKCRLVVFAGPVLLAARVWAVPFTGARNPMPFSEFGSARHDELEACSRIRQPF
jgi:hypothetical protein